jgi:hypothetical protein
MHREAKIADWIRSEILRTRIQVLCGRNNECLTLTRKIAKPKFPGNLQEISSILPWNSPVLSPNEPVAERFNGIFRHWDRKRVTACLLNVIFEAGSKLSSGHSCVPLSTFSKCLDTLSTGFTLFFIPYLDSFLVSIRPLSLPHGVKIFEPQGTTHESAPSIKTPTRRCWPG